jgi:hypothetical protein
MDMMQELPIQDREAIIRANTLVSYSYTESVCIDEVDSGLCQSIKVATMSGQYPLLKGLVVQLERLGMKDKNPILKYNQVSSLVDYSLTCLCVKICTQVRKFVPSLENLYPGLKICTWVRINVPGFDNLCKFETLAAL